ncbi:DUF1853 family protein [Marinospirillum perlucidum]|uniref:DUF1853 family protein n=1 Tax=Marinospirillum perlucidum TaxID=1982602 RepID=UPI000DF1279D|nr:DUF1853 family protein [Marinospirillum perlucidum]
MPKPKVFFWEDYQHPLVRDLAWILTTPDLITSPWPQKPLPDLLGWEKTSLQDWLQQLDQHPEALEAKIRQLSRPRLGAYHEALWKFLLQTSPGVELLAHNLPIRHNKRTLGELDLVFADRQTHRLYHLEVAVKFYLGLPLGPGKATSASRWIGPGGMDSLAHKASHTLKHQLPLSDHPLAREALQAICPKELQWTPQEPVEKYLALPGYLFYPWQEHLPSPQGSNLDHQQGLWLYHHQLADLLAELDPRSRGQRLQKPHWLATPSDEYLIPLQELEKQLQQQIREEKQPLLLAIRQADQGWLRCFLVPDDWPHKIPLPPRDR